MNRRVLWVALAVVVGAIGVTWQVTLRGSPRYAISRIESAIQERNHLRFQAHVDLDRALPAAVDQLMAQALVSTAQDASGIEALGVLLGTAMVDQMKPALIQALRTAILDAGQAHSIASSSLRQDRILT